MAEYLRYPLKNIGSQDDYFKIQIFKYQPPGLELTGGFALRTSEQAFDAAVASGVIQKSESTIILPMPATIQDNNAASWTSGTMTPIQATLSNAAQAAILGSNPAASLAQSTGNFFENITDSIKTGEGQKGTVATAVGMAVQAALGQGNIDQLVSRATGQVFNQNVELLFNGVSIRPAYQFSFDMVPRSQKESEMIKEIIRTFKINMTPSKGNTSIPGGGLFVTAPNIFKLQYMSGGDQHPFLHRFKLCALTQMNVNYNGSSQYATYSDATPVHMQMSLQFQELSPIYKEDYKSTEGKIGVGY